MAGIQDAPEVAAVPEVAPANTAAPAPSAPAPNPTPDAPLSGLPRVSVAVFIQVSGQKADQMAGFKAWAKTKQLTPRTIPEWKLAVTEYANRPV